jgi:SAM-dependent methyltransferase
MSLAIATEVTKVLNDATGLLRAGEGTTAVKRLCDFLAEIHADVGESRFKRDIVPACRRHEIFPIVQQDPYSRRAFEKPRGYAGDAVMMDYVYSGTAPVGTSAVGQAVFDGTTRTSNGWSVVERKCKLARWIDETSKRVKGARIVSLAAGHLREADDSRAWRSNGISEWIAIDQDERSLARIRHDYGSPIIRTVHGSVLDLLKDRIDFEPADLVYSAGLFDYLSDRVAARTAEKLFDRLRPGGTLVLANFTPGSEGRHFMEAFMDWKLIYRGADQLESLISGIPLSKTSSLRSSPDRHGNLVYLEVRKAA